MASSNSLLKKTTLCVVTGANRGLGKSIAEKLATKFPPGSAIVLVGRNVDKLQEVRKQIKENCLDITVTCLNIDQSNLNDCEGCDFSALLPIMSIDIGDYEQAMIIHNAGVTGDLTKLASEMTDRDMVEETMNVNVTGTILLNGRFLSTFTDHVVQSRVVINISSLAALQPFPSWSLYCAGKAARDMFFLTVAKEDKDTRVLSYAPGPLDTDMQANCRKCKDETLQKTFTEMHEQGKLLTCGESVDKLIQLLEKNSFESGAHIDFYDV